MKTVKARHLKKSEDIRKFYNKHGWVAIKNDININLIKSIRQDLNKLFSYHVNRTYNNGAIYLDRNNKKKLYYLHQRAEKTLSLSMLSSIFNKRLRKIRGNTLPVLNIQHGLILGLPKDKRLVYYYHQESAYYKSFQYLTTCHFPLFYKSKVFNGTMSALDKSHKLGKLKYKRNKPSKDSYVSLITKNIEKLKKKHDEIFFELNPGDVLYFHQDLIHRSNYNHSKNTRTVGVYRLAQISDKGELREISAQV